MAAADLEKRRAFAVHYATSGNATAAAKAAGVSGASAHSMGYKWLKSPDVLAMVREQQEEVLKELAGPAIAVLRSLLSGTDVADAVRLAAAREVLDRAGFSKAKREHAASGRRRVPDMRNLSREELAALASYDLTPGDLETEWPL